MFRKRWIRRLFFSLGIGVVVLIAGVWWDMHSVRRDGEERLAQVVAEIDRTDPLWRWDDLDAAREPIPDEQNGTLLVPKFKLALGKPFAYPTRADGFSDLLSGVPPNRLLDESDFSLIEQFL